jgi:nitroreductase
MELFEAIKTRRSIRRYKTDPVDDKKIEAILEAGRWAPSWSNTQCWRFIVVRDPQVKSRLSESFLRYQLPDKKMDNPAINMVKTAPVVIVVCAKLATSGTTPGVGSGDFFTDKGDWYMFDTALAVENMVLAAHALGLGTVILGTFDAGKVEQVLNVSEGYRAVTLFPVGVPDHIGKVPPRKELTEIAFKDKWGE